MGLIIPEPGYVAAKVMPGGTDIALGVLGVALTLNDAKAGDDEINEWMDSLATSHDPVWQVNQHYIDLEQQHPFLMGHLEPLTGWTEQPSITKAHAAQSVGANLRDIAWSVFEDRCEGDILGKVYNQMLAIGGRRVRVFDYVSIAESERQFIEAGYFMKPLNTFLDAWCGSGTRAIAAVNVQKEWLNHTGFPVRLNDARPRAVALAGLNMVVYDITWDTKLTCDKEWAERWGATSFLANSPTIMASLPPELAIDAPKVFKGKRLGR